MSASGATPWALAAAWALVALAAVWPRRPRATPALPTNPGASSRADVATRVGRALRRAGRSGADVDVRSGDRERGIGAMVAAGLLVVSPPLAPVALVAGLLVGPLRDRRAAAASAAAAADALPDAVDLLALAVGSGLPVAGALELVAPHIGPPLGPAMATAASRVGHGAPLDLALDPLGAVAATRPLAALLLAAHVDGAPVVASLERLADEARADRRRAIETRARQVPVRMLFPLVLCTLPAFVLLTIVPPVLAALGGIRT